MNLRRSVVNGRYVPAWGSGEAGIGPFWGMRPRLLLPLAALLACLPGPRQPARNAATSTPPAAAAPATAKLRQLAWLEGRWRGSEDVGDPFYESYRIVSDYLIEGHTWTDSTFRTAKDTSLIQLQGDEVVTSSNAVAVELDDTSVRFEARGGTSGYTWTRTDPDRWTAVITWTNAKGEPQRKTYFMTRVRE